MMKTLLCLMVFGVFAGMLQANPWNRHTIDASSAEAGKLGADGVRLADANGDGLMDVVTGWENGDAIRVCLNPGPEKSKEPWPGVTVGKVRGAEDAVFADIDGDGALDVVTCTEGKTKTVFVHWASTEKDRYLDANAWKTEAVPALKGNQMWMYALPFDVNADGRLDLIFGSKNEGATVGWLEAPKESPRKLSTWNYHKLYDAGWIMSIRDEDLDNDGDRDVIFSDRKGNSSGVWWLENVGASVSEYPDGAVFAKPRLLGLSGKEVMFIDIADVNDDKRLDVIAAIKPEDIGFLLQPLESQAEWKTEFQAGTIPQDRFGTAKAVRVIDLDENGKLDLAITCENAKGKLSGCFRVSLHYGMIAGELLVVDISGPEGVKYDRIEMIDLDGDGDLDLMTCEERDNLGVFWYENPAK